MPFRIPQKPRILITSRDRDWEFEVDVLILHELDEVDAITFVKKGLGLKEDDHSQNDAILQLVTTLQCFPLALQQAISFIKQQRMVIDYNIEMYLKSFEANAKTLLDSKIPAGSFNSYKRTTFTTWRMTTERIAADEDHGSWAIKILNILAYLGADNIPRKILDGLGEEHEVLFALRLLVKYSMLDSQPKEGTLSIHRLVQEVTRIEHKNAQIEKSTLKEVLQLLQTNELGISSVVDHVIVAWNRGQKFEELVKEFSSFPSEITKALCDLQRYKEANSFGNNALLALQKALVVPEHVDAFRVRYQVAKVDYELGKYKQSVEVFRDILQNAKGTFGESHPITIEVEHYLGMALNKHGSYRESFKVSEGLLDKTKKAFGEDDVRSVDTLLNMATNLNQLGEYKEALKLYEVALSNYKRLLGDSHRKVFLATQNMALLYRGIGQLGKATDTLRNVYSTAKVSGQNDTLTLLIGHNLSLYLYLQGKYEEAIEVGNDVLERRKEIVGADHPETLTTSNVLGKLLRCQGKYEEALLIHQNVYQKLVKHYGKDHSHTLSAKLDISYIWSAIGMKEEALLSLQEVLESQMTHLGPHNHQTLATQLEIAKALEALKRYKEAVELLVEVEEKIRIAFGEEHHQLPGIREFIEKTKSYL